MSTVEPTRSPAVVPLSEFLRLRAIESGQAKAIINVTIRALRDGETDLELEAADTLAAAAEIIEQLEADLFAESPPSHAADDEAATPGRRIARLHDA